MAKRKAYSQLCKAIEAGHFVFTGELEPKKILDLSKIIHSAKEMKKTKRIVAANVTDGPQGDAYMSSLVPSFKVQEEAGIEAVWQVTVRDRNRVALFGDVIAGAILGLKNILFVGFKNTSEISTYYVISDIFVLPSMYDPTPKALNEALLFGLPVVVSDSVGTANDLVQHQVNGLIYPVGDVDKLAFEIDRLISDKELYSRLSKVAEDSVAGWSPCANVDGVVAALDFCHKGNGS